MKKKILFLYIVPFSLYSTFAFIEPYNLPEHNTATIKASSKFIIDAGPSLSWWRCPKQIMLDVGGNEDFIKNNISEPVPGFSFSLKRRFWQSKRPTAIYIGWKVNYAKRSKAIKTDYFDHNTTQATLEIHQDIKNIRIAPFFEWILEQKKFSLSTWIAPTIGIKAINKFAFWEKATKSYTGQTIEPYQDGAFGEFGTTLLLSKNKNRLFSVGYSFLIGRVTLKKRIIIGTPDPNADQIFHDQLLLEDVDRIYLPREPSIRYHAHTVRFGFAIGF